MEKWNIGRMEIWKSGMMEVGEKEYNMEFVFTWLYEHYMVICGVMDKIEAEFDQKSSNGQN